MPDLKLGDDQIGQLIAFLTWVSRIDTAGWPPRPLLVSGGFPGSNRPEVEKAAVSNDPVALGEALFRRSPPACSSCHSTAEGVQLVGPSLAGIATRAEQTLANPAYRGQAKTAADYVRESISAPSAFLVSGSTFSAAGQSFMPNNFSRTLNAGEIDQLVLYLMTLK
jgi:nitric oxide reductase subunit C